MALDAGHLLKAFKLLLQGKTAEPNPTTNKFGSKKSDAPQSAYRPGGLGPGEMPRRPLGPGLITFTIALTAVVAWLLLNSG